MSGFAEHVARLSTTHYDHAQQTRQRWRAARYIATHARSVDDCRELLAMLGLRDPDLRHGPGSPAAT